jgi:hypothetical protein
MEAKLAETNIREANDILAGRKPAQAANDSAPMRSASLPMTMPGAQGR